MSSIGASDEGEVVLEAIAHASSDCLFSGRRTEHESCEHVADAWGFIGQRQVGDQPVIKAWL